MPAVVRSLFLVCLLSCAAAEPSDPESSAGGEQEAPVAHSSPDQPRNGSRDQHEDGSFGVADRQANLRALHGGSLDGLDTELDELRTLLDRWSRREPTSIAGEFTDEGAARDYERVRARLESQFAFWETQDVDSDRLDRQANRFWDLQRRAEVYLDPEWRLNHEMRERLNAPPPAEGGGGRAGDSFAGLGAATRRRPAGPRIRFLPPAVQGPLPVEVARRLVQRHRRELQRCYRASGRVQIRFEIDAGVVRRAEDAGSDPALREVTQCVLGQAYSWPFPRYAEEVVVTFPMEFAPPP
ncbi:MAG: hypothetical protein AAGE52_28385 [Myxococcota bacterium]